MTTVRLVSPPMSMSSTSAPSTAEMAAAIVSITLRSRPSEKLGTHSTSPLTTEDLRGGFRVSRVNESGVVVV